MKKLIFVMTLTILCMTSYAFEMTDEVKSFAANMESCYGVPEEKAIKWLEAAELDETALKRMDRQTESKSWGYYKPLFVTDTKAFNGFEFYSEHQDALEKAEKQFGVSRYVITAILGVETDYGRFRLKHRAIDTLTTLTFYYPRRAAFFGNELKQLFILSDEENTDPTEILSSYAGAVGMPQFMPSNITKFGVDFDGDGKIDLVNSVDDAIGSVAKYLSLHGYKLNKPTAVEGYVSGDEWKKYANRGMRPKFTVSTLADAGIVPSLDVKPERKASFYELKLSQDESQYWLFFDNFYAITRYNPSIRYALAVTLLAFEIRNIADDSASVSTSELCPPDDHE